MSLSVDWNSVFVPAIGLAEIVVRGSLMYLGLFVIMRFMARRQAGHFGPADLLVIVLIADAAQNGLGKEYSSVTEGLALVVTIVAWEYLLDWLAWRFPATRPYLKPASLTLIRDGRLNSSEPAKGNDHRRRTKIAATRTKCRELRRHQAGYPRR